MDISTDPADSWEDFLRMSIYCMCQVGFTRAALSPRWHASSWSRHGQKPHPRCKLCGILWYCDVVNAVVGCYGTLPWIKRDVMVPLPELIHFSVQKGSTTGFRLWHHYVTLSTSTMLKHRRVVWCTSYLEPFRRGSLMWRTNGPHKFCIVLNISLQRSKQKTSNLVRMFSMKSTICKCKTRSEGCNLKRVTCL